MVCNFSIFERKMWCCAVNSLVFSAEFAEEKTRKMPKIKQVAEMTQVRIPSRLIIAIRQLGFKWPRDDDYFVTFVLSMLFCDVYASQSISPDCHTDTKWFSLFFLQHVFINKCPYKANYNSIITIREKVSIWYPRRKFRNVKNSGSLCIFWSIQV